MKFRTLILASTIAATATGYAFAQGTMSESSHAGSKSMTQGQMSKDKMSKEHGTTGAGINEPSNAAKSPAATSSTVKKNK